MTLLRDKGIVLGVSMVRLSFLHGLTIQRVSWEFKTHHKALTEWSVILYRRSYWIKLSKIKGLRDAAEGFETTIEKGPGSIFELLAFDPVFLPFVDKSRDHLSFADKT